VLDNIIIFVLTFVFAVAFAAWVLAFVARGVLAIIERGRE